MASVRTAVIIAPHGVAAKATFKAFCALAAARVFLASFAFANAKRLVTTVPADSPAISAFVQAVDSFFATTSFMCAAYNKPYAAANVLIRFLCSNIHFTTSPNTLMLDAVPLVNSVIKGISSSPNAALASCTAFLALSS